jgi:HPt (histidine-containing phosphotransfer) domain-containing protein
VTSDLFAERFAAVRERFTAKLGARIDEIEATLPALTDEGAIETLARAHRRTHDLCGVGPTLGFVATGQAARQIEQALFIPLKAGRALWPDEVAIVTEGIARLRAAARAETRPIGQA